jgi:hypothetical protein
MALMCSIVLIFKQIYYNLKGKLNYRFKRATLRVNRRNGEDLQKCSAFIITNVRNPNTTQISMENNIAVRKIFSISPDGEKKFLKIAIGQPYQVDDVSWACPLIVEGLHKELKDTVGIDSWQALGLAIALVRQLLGYYVEDGAELYWKEGGEKVSLDDLFPQLKSF